MKDWLSALYLAFFSSDVMVAPEYLAVTLLIAWGIYLWRRGKGGFWHWVVPRRIYTHASSKLDLELFVIGRLLTFSGVFGKLSLTTAMAVTVARLVGTGGASGHVSPWILALALFLATDCAMYWLHRINHNVARLWPLHAVHHSAEVLTPFTAYRQHPLSYVVSTLFVSVFVGLIQGLLIGTLSTDATVATIAGINAFFVLATLAMANFHHSHLWITFPTWIEHLLISPAQHQIHHSTQPQHFNRNYGQSLALWDWMFGTLELSRGQTQPRFGLTGKADAPLMKHQLGASLLDPVRRMFQRRS